MEVGGNCGVEMVISAIQDRMKNRQTKFDTCWEMFAAIIYFGMMDFEQKEMCETCTRS